MIFLKVDGSTLPNSFHMVDCVQSSLSVSAGDLFIDPPPQDTKICGCSSLLWNDVVFVYNLGTSSDKLYIIFRLLVILYNVNSM